MQLRNCDAAGSPPMRWVADVTNLVPAPYFGRGASAASAMAASASGTAMAPALAPSFTFEPQQGTLAPGESMDLTVSAAHAALLLTYRRRHFRAVMCRSGLHRARAVSS